MSADPLVEATQRVRQAIPLLDATGLSVVELVPGRAAAEAPFEPNRNHVGIVYAGSLFSLAEVLGGLIPAVTWSCEAYVPVVASVQITFLRPATTMFRAVGTVSEADIARVADELEGGADRVWFGVETEIWDEFRVVARSTGSYQLRRVPQAGPQ